MLFQKCILVANLYTLWHIYRRLFLTCSFTQVNPASALAPTAGTEVPGEFEEEVHCAHDIIHTTRMLENCDWLITHIDEQHVEFVTLLSYI